jgi:PAS domain S-box-containing protein
MVLNLNEHEQINQLVRESPGLSTSIIGSAMDAIIAVDDAQRIVLFNVAAEKIFACPANEAIGSSVERFIPQRFRVGHSARVHRFDESGITNRTLHGLGTLWGLRATGEEFPMEASISKIESGGKKFFTVIIRDITERIRSEETLRKSEERFRLAAQAGRMFAYEWDVATDVIIRSGDIATVLGSSGEASLTRQQLLAKIHPDDRALFNASVHERTPEHPDVQISYRLLHPDGSVIWVEKTAHAFFDAQGRMVRMIGMVSDVTQRKWAEDKLREYERAVEGSEEMIAVVDREYRYLIANRQFLKRRKLTREQVVGRFAHEVLNKVFFENIAKPKLDECFQGRVVRYETKYTYPELGERDVSVAYFPIEGANGIDRVACITQDITDRKLAEKALRESEEQFRTLAEAIPQLCWMARGDGYVFWYNQRWYKYTGTTPEQMEGWGWQSVHDPRTLPSVLERWKAAISTGDPSGMIFPLRGADGIFRPFLTRVMPIKDAEGRVVRWFGTDTDITELRDAQEALCASEERLRLAQQAAPIGTFEWNIRTDVNTWTPELEALHGLPPGGFGGTHAAFESLVHPDDRARLRDLVEATLKTGQPTKGEWRVVWPNGSVHWIAAYWQVLKNDSGEASRVIGVNIDVTERKQAEEALLGVNRRLIEAQEQERNRIGRELHDDVTQRLALLAIKLQQLNENPLEVPSRAQELHKEIIEISNDVQSLSRGLHSSQLEYLGFVAGMNSWCRDFGERQGLQIDCRHEVRSNLPRDIGLCLFRVLQEALHNAAKHSGVKRIEAELHEVAGEIHLVVSDSGRGFDIEQALAGKGLGLTSMRERIRLINGTLTIDSKPMRGTTIHVRVPLESKHLLQRAAV